MSGEWVWLTRREAAAVAFVLDAVLVDEEPSEVRASLIRALRKIRKVASKGEGT